jgi:hypothetical protein
VRLNLKLLFVATMPLLLLAKDLNTWRSFDRAARHQVVTEGVVTEHRPSEHDTYLFSFAAANGWPHTGVHSPGGCKPDTLKIGETVRVYYNPRQSELCAFDELRGKSLGLVPIELLILAGIIAFSVRKKARATT